MEEKKKRIVTKIGNVFCAKIDEEYKMYFQFIALDKTNLTSDVIRVFKTRYALSDNPKLEDVVKDEVMFNTHVVIPWGIRMGLWDKVGNVKFEEQVRIPFKTFNKPSNIPQLSFDWRVWYTNEPDAEITGPLPEEFRYAEWGGIMAPRNVFNRMRDGKHVAYLTYYDDILAGDESFERKRELMMMPCPASYCEE